MHNVTLSLNNTYALEDDIKAVTRHQSDVQQPDLRQHQGPDLFL